MTMIACWSVLRPGTIIITLHLGPKTHSLKINLKKILFFKITYSIFSNISNTCSFTLSSLSDGDVHRPGDEGCA